MRNVSDLDVDYLVVGHGAAGLLCASLIASHGKNVAVAGRAATATSLSTGCLTLFRPREITMNPYRFDFDTLSRSVPPFSSLFWQRPEDLEISLSELLSFIIPRLRSQGLPMVGNFESSYSVLSNTGIPSSSSVCPGFVEKGRLDENDRDAVALLGILGLRDFDPDIAVSVFESITGRRNIRPYWTQLPLTEGRYDMSQFEIAALGERFPVEEGIAGALKEVNEEMVGLPPFTLLPQFVQKMESLERLTGKIVFEVVTPMSVQGERLQDALENIAKAEGCRLLKGLTATDIDLTGGEASSVVLRSRSRAQKVTFSRLILATGDLVGGGLVPNGCGVEEAMSSLQVETHCDASSVPSERNLRDVMQSGLRTDSNLRLFTKEGTALKNVYGAGSLLSGFSLPTGVGLGGVLLTSWMAALNAMGVN